MAWPFRLYQCQSNSGIFEISAICLRDLLVGDDVMNGIRRNNRRKTAPAKLARVTNGDNPSGNFDHNLIYFGFLQIRRAQSQARIKTIDTQEQNVGAQVMQRLFGQRADQGKGVLANRASSEDHLDLRVGEFLGDVDGVGDDCQPAEVTQGPGDRRSRGPRIEQDRLAFFHQPDCGLGNSHFLRAVQLFLFLH